LPSTRLKLLKRLLPVIALIAASGLGIHLLAPSLGLGMNLIADAIVLTIVVFVVDATVKRIEADRLKPARAAGFSELLGIQRRLYQALRMALMCTADRNDIPALRSYADGSDAGAPRLAQIMSRVRLSAATGDMTSNGKAIVSLDWKTFLIGTATGMRRDIERFLPRYMSLMEPELVAALRTVEDLRLVLFFGTMHQVVHQTEQGMWLQAIMVHASFDAELLRMAASEGITVPYPVGAPLIDDELIERIESGELPYSGAPMKPISVEMSRQTPSSEATGSGAASS
jgi:hypothetical protein